jgi:hypothetical protein
MGSKLTFSVESHGRRYAALELDKGAVSVRAGRAELRGVMLAHAVQWVKEHNPDPTCEPRITLVSVA